MEAIIKDATPFLTDWDCPTIIDRQKEVNKFEDIVLIPLLQKKTPPCVYVFGGSGSGKTFTINKKIKEQELVLQKVIPHFGYLYINIREQGIPSYNTVLIKISDYLQRHLPVELPIFGRIEQISLKGWDRVALLTMIKGIITIKKLTLLLVVDEVDRIYNYEKSDDFFYTFLDMYKSFPRDEQMGITTIFISNNISLLDKLEKPTRDRLSHVIHFLPYSEDDLFQILKVTAQYSIENHQEISDSTYQQVAREISNVTKSAREAKLLLYNYLHNSSFRDARLETDKDLLRAEITKLSPDQLLVLFAVLKRNENIQKMLIRNKPERYRYLLDPTAGSVFDEYKKACERMATFSKTYKTFTRLSLSLEREGLIKTDVKSLGRARGVTTLMYSGEEPAVLEPVVIEQLKQIFTFASEGEQKKIDG